MSATKKLESLRLEAAYASGGTSNQLVKDRVIALLRKRERKSCLLDYGAGRGGLLSLIAREFPNTRLCGVDYLPRPTSLPASVNWIQQDLNENLSVPYLFDVVICSEVIEHLENPRHVVRQIADVLVPGGILILTMPNQESIRSFLAVAFGGHFASFLGTCYPAHITALLRLDLVRICRECDLSTPEFSYTNDGGIPKFPHISWQAISFGALKGRLFSDNIIMTIEKPISEE